MSLLLVLVLLLSAALSLEAADRFSASPHDLTNKKILMVSIAFRGHAIPLMNLGAELADRGYDIVFASHAEAQPWFDEILAERRGSMHPSNGTATFVSLGKFPYPETTLRSNLAFACEEQTHIRGMLHLLNTIYKPLVRPMQNALLTLFDNMAANDEMPRLAVVDAGERGRPPRDQSEKAAHHHQCALAPRRHQLGHGGRIVRRIDPRIWNRLFHPHVNTGPRRQLALHALPLRRIHAILLVLQRPRRRAWHPRASGSKRFFCGVPYNRQHRIRYSVSHTHASHGASCRTSAASSCNEQIRLRSPLPPRRVAKPRRGTRRVRESRQHDDYGSSAHRSDRSWIDASVDARIVDASSHYRAALPADIPFFRAKTLGGLDHYKVLAHDAVKVVVSHCGMAAAQEALYFGKPVVCLPLFADQNDVSMRIAEFGAGEIIPSTDVTPDTLSASALSIIDRHEYAARAQMLGERIRRAGSSHRAASVVEQIAELGDDAARMAHVQLPWHRENHLDVLLVLLAFVFTGAALVRIVAVCVTRSVVKWLARVAPEVLAPCAAKYSRKGRQGIGWRRGRAVAIL